MKKILAMIALAFLLLPTAALAAAYSALITVTESSSNSYTQLPISVSVDNDYLVDNNFISSTGLDTRVLDGSTELQHLVVSDRTMFSVDIAADTQHLFSYTTGNTTLDDFPVIVGYNGYVTVSDDASLELGDVFKIELKGYVDTSSGSDKNLIFKDAAFKLYISAEGSIKAEITGGTSVTATSISSGVHTIKVTADVTNLKIYIDTVEEDSSSLGGVGVPDNTNNWNIMQNNVMPYVEYLKIWTQY